MYFQNLNLKTSHAANYFSDVQMVQQDGTVHERDQHQKPH